MTQEKPHYSAEEAKEALFTIPTPSDRSEWLKISTAAKAAGISYEDWDNWSRRGEGYNEASNLATWNSLKEDGRITAGTLFFHAKNAGWHSSNSGAGTQRKPAAREAAKPQQQASQQTQKAAPAKPKPSMTEAQIIAKIEAAEKDQALALPYLDTRGISPETAERFRLGFSRPDNALVIPYAETPYFALRYVDVPPNCKDKTKRRFHNIEGYSKPLFNSPALRSGADVVFVVEGQIDTMTIEQCGGACVGSNEAKELLAELDRPFKDGKPITAKAFYIVPDNDEKKGTGKGKDEEKTTGEAKAEAIYEAVKAKGYKAEYWRIDPKFHDINDWYLKDPPSAGKWVLEGCAHYKNEQEAQKRDYQNRYSQKGRISDFLENAEIGIPVIPTGFNDLDRTLGGGLTEGLVIVGAKSSMGKTTFAVQLADQIAGNPDESKQRDILYISLEQRAEELLAKSVSRTIYGFCGQKISAFQIRTKFGKLAPDAKDLVEDCAAKYASTAGKRVFVWEARGQKVTVGKIRELVADHKAITGNSPIVIVDYLQVLSAEDPRTDKQTKLEEAISALTGIGREYQTTVIAISSYNRANYHNDASMESFNGTSQIEYSADILLSLQPNFTALGVKPKELDEKKWRKTSPRYMVVEVLKQRLGPTCVQHSFTYWPEVDIFEETGLVEGEWEGEE